MNLYLESGYCDIKSIIELGLPFTFVIGGRGTGKTYGALKYAIETKTRILLMRRTQTQTDLINNPDFSPFKSIEHDMDITVTIQAATKYSRKIILDSDDEEFLLGYTCALSTISNLRGFDASDVKLLIYDEFIPERHERLMKEEGDAFKHAYETINRNRELKGDKPLQVLALANPLDIANPIFRKLELIDICDKMKIRNKNVYISNARGLAIIMLDDSPISQMKKTTALYKLTENSSFNDMALSNDFAYNSNENISSRKLIEYRLIVGIGDIYIYKHKSKKEYYVSIHKQGDAPYYSDDEINLDRFITKYGKKFYMYYMANRFIFESQLAKTTFEWYIT